MLTSPILSSGANPNMGNGFGSMVVGESWVLAFRPAQGTGTGDPVVPLCMV
jgi:hypothetical protein